MRVLELPGILQAAGLPVVEMAGWKVSGQQLRAVRGIVAHHTATGPRVGDDAVERLLRNGRPDLPGPLCQLGLRRDGTWVVIASGKCNHNGYGVWGNDSIGVEAYNDGVGEKWPQAQYDSYVAGCRALSRHFKVPVRGHKETDPGRKIDPTFDMDKFRAAIDAAPTPPEDDMPPAPAIVDVGGARYVFVRGTDAGLYMISPDKSQHAFKGTLTSSPSATARPGGLVDVVARGTDGATWIITVDPAAKQIKDGWKSLGGKS